MQRKSRHDRMRASLKEVKEKLRLRMHRPIPEQGRWLKQVVSGYFNYHAAPTNFRALMAFRHHVADLWRRSLGRRSQKDRTTWARGSRSSPRPPNRASSIPGRANASASDTLGGNRMP
ncbi:MAG TPA: hypothetical protein VFE63_10955 [Roseiarcus sp.]|nr:hypothetical protein [Roseiarcus sp.]